MKTITGVTFASTSFNYDGNEKKIEISGALPDGVSVSYTDNTGTDAGDYNATAILSGEGYYTLTLNATLTINKIDMNSLEFKGASFTYDTNPHNITLTGNVPSDAAIIYRGGEDGKNSATSVGKYSITVTVSHKNYNTYTETAVLSITSREENLSVFFYGSKVYFQNNLDNNNLYIYNQGELSFAGRDKPISVIEVGGNLYYVSNSLFSSGIYEYNTAQNKSQCLYEVSSVDHIASDGIYIYYNVNAIFGKENGIYRIKISDLSNKEAEIVPEKITSALSGDLVYAEGRIYFANNSDGGKLYSVPAAGNDATPVKLYDYKISEIITDGEKIYFVREFTLSNLLVGAAIYSIDVSGGLSALQDDNSSRVVRITISKGKYLTVIGDYIYFVNTDLLTSTIFGDGIYRASIDGSGWIEDVYSNLNGATKVVDGTDDKIFALATDNEKLYYYRANTKHLYSCNLDNKIETDLMADYVPPEKVEIILTTHEKAELYNGEIYYINMKDGGKLYKYNVSTELDIRITNMPVADFAIYDDVIYYSAARLLWNYDLYCMNTVTGELKLISKEKCANFSFHDGKMYFTCFSGDNMLKELDLETLEIRELFGKEIIEGGKSVDDGLTTVYDGKVYFVADSLLYTYEISSGSFAIVNDNVKPSEYLIYDGKILMMNTDGANKAVIYDIATDTLYTVADLKGSILTAFQPDDIRSFFVYKDELYYYRDIAVGSSKKGLYKVVSNGDSYEAVLVDDMDKYCMCEAIVIEDKVYFLDVWQVKDTIPSTANTAKLYVLDLNTMEVTVLN